MPLPEFVTFDDAAKVTDLLGDDVYPLERAGKNKGITGVNLIAAIILNLSNSFIGKFGVNVDITSRTGGGANDLDGQDTTSLPYKYLLLTCMNDQIQIFQYQSPAVATADDTQPVDNPTHRWRQVL